MVELKTYKCDRCGTIFQSDPIRDPSIVLEDTSKQIPLGLNHLCHKCFDEFINWTMRRPLDAPFPELDKKKEGV